MFPYNMIRKHGTGDFFPKRARNRIWTPLLLIRKLMLPLISASEILVRFFILEKQVFLEEKVEGIGVWVHSKNQSLKKVHQYITL